MSTISQFAGSGVKQIITGFVNDVAPTNGSAGTGEDYFYYDITHGGTVNTSKCTVTFTGSSGYPNYGAVYSYGLSNSNFYTRRIVSARLTSTTNLRLAAQFDQGVGNSLTYFYFIGRFTIVEYF